MPKYKYIARDKNGALAKGELEGPNTTEIAKQIMRLNLSPISISVFSETKNPLAKLFARLKWRKPTLEDLVFFSRQMYSLTKAGVPLVRAIKVVEDSSKNEKLKKALEDMLTSLKAGRALANSMANYPEVFTELMTALVQVGENSGNVDKVFQQMSSYFEREEATRKRVSEVLRYPITVLVVVTIAIVVVNLLVLPAFSKFFTEYGAKLPLATKILMSISNFMTTYWLMLLIIIVLITFLLTSFFRSKHGRYIFDKFKLEVPIVGSLLQRIVMARFSRSFALCSRSGVPPLQSIALVSNALDNMYAKEKILKMRTNIEHGESLIASATASGIFSPLVLQMLNVGEETGEIERLLDEVADYYEQETDYEIKRLGDAMEPILLIFIGFVVLMLALGIYLPMWDISRVLFGKIS